MKKMIGLAVLTWMLTAGLLFAQESSARFFRILGPNQITITNFSDGVMTWEGQNAGAAVTVEVSEGLTVSNGWSRYTEVLGDDSRGSLKVFDGNTPAGMVLIPSGINSGTDPYFGAYSLTNESAFYMDRTEVTKALWDRVYNWAVANGYSFYNGDAVSGKAANHPVHTVNWKDCAIWCIARSQMEGRTPCYNRDLSCNFSANGYRLPTIVEWEYAARGGLSGKRFPWGDTINYNYANYRIHPLYDDGYVYTSPAGSFAANGYGLYDMIGNVGEWCNDEATFSDNHWRGGSWNTSVLYLGCGGTGVLNQLSEKSDVGFRTVCR